MPPTLDAVLADKQNRIAFQELCRAMRRRGPRPIAMVGAGTSVRLEYPSWPGLLKRLDELATNPTASPSQQAAPSVEKYPDMLWRAEEYRRRLGDARFGKELQEIFKPSGRTDDFLDDLVRLPFSHFVTTNYDPALEEAHQRVFGREAVSINWDDRDDVVEFITRVADPIWRRRYVHLHGRWDQPSSIVLSDADYTRRYVQSDDTPKKLFALFALRRFVFIGFSLSDPDLMAVLREVAARIGGTEARHFALVGYQQGENLEMHRNRFIAKFGVAPVFFDTTGGDYTGLPVLVRALLDACGREPKKAATSTGIVKFFKGDKRYGFIRPDEGGKDVFVHLSAIQMEGFESIQPGDRVEFEMQEGSRGPQAASVRRVPQNLRSLQLGSEPAGRAPLSRSAEPPPRGEIPVDPNDPIKGCFGGIPTANGKVLRAMVRPAHRDDDWFEVRLEVAAEPGRPPMEGTVKFHLHPTFTMPEIAREAVGGVARLKLTAWGAFTVGAETSDGTRLELDLAELPSAPMAFRMR